MNKIRVNQFFLDFDKLRKGIVTKDQFRRALKLAGIDLEDYQYDLLVAKYQLDNMQNIDYYTFTTNIDKIFTTKGIEKNPLFGVPQIASETTLPARRYYLQMQEQEREKLHYILDLIKKEISTKRLLFKPHFQDFDVVKNGFVTRSQFLRVLYQFDIYPKNEYIDVLLKCYTDNGNLNEVNYYDFCRDVDGADPVTTTINNTHKDKFLSPSTHQKFEPYIYKDSNQNFTEVIAKLQRKVKEERIRVHEFLRDFDLLRSGAITNSQFRIGLNMAKLPISNSDFVVLCEQFSVPEKPGMIRWKDFSDLVEEIFTLKNLEKQPEREINTSSLMFKTTREGMNANQIASARKLIERFKFVTVATRLYIKQFFQDWDRLGRNKVTPKQFRQVLATVRFNMSEEEYKAVTSYYLCDDGYVNYVDFIRDTSPEGSVQGQSSLSKSGLNAINGDPAATNNLMFESQVVSGTQSAANGNGKTPNYPYMADLDVDPMKVLERIKRDVRISRTRLKEYLQDFDGLRKGSMTKNKFFGSIDKLKYFLNDK
jgi:Ca2+-binding EF-hand superfamily protein